MVVPLENKVVGLLRTKLSVKLSAYSRGLFECEELLAMSTYLL